MVWLIYNALFSLAFIVALPYYLFRMFRRGGYRQGFAQRVGCYGEAMRRKIAERRRVWVHAVSVGEVSVALRFMDTWRREQPDAAFVLSVNTSTAHALAERSLAPADVLVYFPVDLPPVLRRVVGVLQPRMLVLTEGEWWPNLIRMVRSRDVPVVLVNGRMSERSFRGYRRLRWFFSRVVRMVNLLCVQSREDADRLLALGAAPAALQITGNAKYDAAWKDPDSARRADEILQAAGLSRADTLLLGGSTWPGEEAVLLDIYIRFRAFYPALRLVLIPRHAERREQVLAEIRSRGLRVVQRSRMAGGTRPTVPPDVLLVDTTGELRHFFAVASLVFMGKSLTAHGGQNLIEPAAYGKPVVVGPNLENFAEVAQDFLAADAIIQVPDAETLSDRLGELLADPALRSGYGERAAALVHQKRGSLERILKLVSEMA